jgi:uncharacterized membrane protein (UPF0127 family)
VISLVARGARRGPRALATAAIVTALGAAVLVGCGGGDDGADDGSNGGGSASDAGEEGGPDAGTSAPPSDAPASDLVELSGGAPAAEGAGVEPAPGEADRAALEAFAAGDVSFDEVAISITGDDGTATGWCVLLAALAAQRARGLMEVTDLGGYAGMLFVWDADSSSSFYMRNTPTPLSIAWFDADGELVSTADMEPCDDVEGCPTYPPAGSYRFALEVPMGELADMGVADGSRLAVGGSCAVRT